MTTDTAWQELFNQAPADGFLDPETGERVSLEELQRRKAAKIAPDPVQQLQNIVADQGNQTTPDGRPILHPGQSPQDFAAEIRRGFERAANPLGDATYSGPGLLNKSDWLIHGSPDFGGNYIGRNEDGSIGGPAGRDEPLSYWNNLATKNLGYPSIANERKRAVPFVPPNRQISDTEDYFSKLGLDPRIATIPTFNFQKGGGGFYPDLNRVDIDPRRFGTSFPNKNAFTNFGYESDPIYHETLHAFESLLSPESRKEMQALIDRNPFPVTSQTGNEWDPGTHHPDLLPPYFDYATMDAKSVLDVGQRYQIPAEVLQFIRDKTPEVLARKAERFPESRQIESLPGLNPQLPKFGSRTPPAERGGSYQSDSGVSAQTPADAQRQFAQRQTNNAAVWGFNDAPAGPLVDPSVTDPRVAQILSQYPPDQRAAETAQYQSDLSATSQNGAYQRAFARFKDSFGNATDASRGLLDARTSPLSKPTDFANPLQYLAGATALPTLAGFGLATAAKPATDKLGPFADPANRALELAPLFAMGPGGLAGKATGLVLSVAGGEASKAAGIGRGAGELFTPIAPGLGGFAGKVGKGAVSRLAEEGASSAENVLSSRAALKTHLESLKPAQLRADFQDSGHVVLNKNGTISASKTIDNILNAQFQAGTKAPGIPTAPATESTTSFGRPYVPGADFPIGDKSQVTFGSEFVPPSTLKSDYSPPGGFNRDFPTGDKSQSGFGPDFIPPSKLKSDYSPPGGFNSDFPTGGPDQSGFDFLAKNKPNVLQRVLNEIKAIPSVTKMVQTGGDIGGFSGRQTLQNWFLNPTDSMQALKQGVNAYFHPSQAEEILGGFKGYADGYTVEIGGRRYAVRPMKAEIGHIQTPGFEAPKGVEDTLLYKAAKSPVTLNANSEASARVIQGGTATLSRNRMIDALVKAQLPDAEQYLTHYDDIARVHAGVGDVPKWAQGISDNFYSLRNIFARAQTYTKVFNEPGNLLAAQDSGVFSSIKDGQLFSASPKGRAALGAFRFSAGEVANLKFLGAVGKSTGLFDVGSNPLGSNFGRLSYSDNNDNSYSTDLLGGYGSMIKSLARGAADAKKGDLSSAAGEGVRFGEYKLAPFPKAIEDTLVLNTDLKNSKIFSNNQFRVDWSDPKSYTSGKIATQFAPFFASDAAQALISGNLKATNPEDLMRAGTNLLTQWAGIPQSIYTPSASQQAAGEWAREKPQILANFPPEVADTLKGLDYSSLTGSEKKVVDSYLQENNPQLYKDLQSDRAGRDNPSTKAAATVAEYWQGKSDQMDTMYSNLINGTGDATKTYAAYKDLKNDGYAVSDAAYGSKEYQKWTSSFPESAIYSALDQYHSVYDAVVKAAGYPDWDLINGVQAAYLEAIKQADPALGERLAFNLQSQPKEEPHPLLQLYKDADAALADYYALPVGKARESYLVAHPDIDTLMRHLGYLAPKKGK